MRQLHETLAHGWMDPALSGSTVRTALVVGERDGRDREIVLSPTTVGDLTVFPIDGAADHLGSLLGQADPKLVDVDLVRSVHTLATKLDR
jgi:hypothetical protein